MKPRSEVSEKIIDRAIYLIGKKGSMDVTVREIAKEADVNVAAINYYFDSKERMFAELAKRFGIAFAEMIAKLHDTTYPPEKRLLLWTDEIMGYLVDYPGVLNLVSRLVAAPPLDSFGAALQQHVDACFNGIRALICQIVDTDDIEQLDFKTIMLTSALAQPETILRGCPFDGEALRSPETRRRFLRLLIEMLKK